MCREKLIGMVVNAIDSLACEEAKYILSDVSERSVCARLAQRMEVLARHHLTGYYVDVENNRKQYGRVKTMLDDHMQEVKVTCDLILHSRGEIPRQDNIIAIEMTKAVHSEEKKNRDRARLRALTRPSHLDGERVIYSADGSTHPEHVCGYQLGAFVELNWRQRTITIEFFANGNRIDRRHCIELVSPSV